MKSVAQTVIEAGRYYTIAAASGNVVGYVEGAEGGATLRLGKYEHSPAQEWAFDRVGESSYRLRCRANGKLIDLMMGGTASGTWLHLWEDVGGASQVWTVVPSNDGRARLRSQWAAGKCMDTVGKGRAAGATLQLWQEADGVDQLWTIAEVKDKPAKKAAPAAEAAPAEAVEEKPAPKKRPGRPKKAAAPVADAAPAAETVIKTPAEAAQEKPAPKKRAGRTKKTAADSAAPAAPAKKPAARSAKKAVK